MRCVTVAAASETPPFQGAGGGQGPQAALAQVGFQGAAFLGQVAAAVGGHGCGQLGCGEGQGVPGAFGYDLGAAAGADEDQGASPLGQQVDEEFGGFNDGGAPGRGVLVRVEGLRDEGGRGGGVRRRGAWGCSA